MTNHDLPKMFDEFVDARKQGFLAAKEYKENGKMEIKMAMVY